MIIIFCFILAEKSIRTMLMFSQYLFQTTFTNVPTNVFYNVREFVPISPRLICYQKIHSRKWLLINVIREFVAIDPYFILEHNSFQDYFPLKFGIVTELLMTF